jgi:hypothetical protein
LVTGPPNVDGLNSTTGQNENFFKPNVLFDDNEALGDELVAAADKGVENLKLSPEVIDEVEAEAPVLFAF